MTYYLAPALTHLVKDELGIGWPRKGSKDGWVGDTAHGARISDHNPDYSSGGVVRAVDIDIKNIDVADLLDSLTSDPRTRYIIHKGRIWENSAVYPRSKGWRKHTGDPHNSHVHISVRHSKTHENNTNDWLTSMISETQMKELKAYIDEAVQRHARFITGVDTGKPLTDSKGNGATLTAIREAQTIIYNEIRKGK